MSSRRISTIAIHTDGTETSEVTHVQEALSGSLPASAAWALASLFAVFVVHAHAAAGLHAQEADAPPIEYEISGRVSAEGRWFPQRGPSMARSHSPRALSRR